ncbi:hypothetical protein MASR2M74_16750 [Paracoccaceae bacterium]
MLTRALALALILLPACAPLPQVTRVLGKTGPTPSLLPLEQLPTAAIPADPGTGLAGQASGLRGRAAALRAR